MPQVTLEEFTDGLLRCKGPARAVEQVAMQAELRQLDGKLKKVLRLLSKGDRLSEPHVPRCSKTDFNGAPSLRVESLQFKPWNVGMKYCLLSAI